MGCCPSLLNKKPNKVTSQIEIIKETEVQNDIPNDQSIDQNSCDLKEYLPNTLRSQIVQPSFPSPKLNYSRTQFNIFRCKNTALPPLPKPGKDLLKKLSLSNENTPISRNLLNRMQTCKSNNIESLQNNLSKKGSLMSITLKKIDSQGNSEINSRESSRWFNKPGWESAELKTNEKAVIEWDSVKTVKDFQNDSDRYHKVNSIVKRQESNGKKWINQYAISNLIAKGPYCKIFQAFDTNNKIVAMKVLNKRLMKARWIGKGKTRISQLYSEVKILQQLSHPNVIQLYEVIDRPDCNKIYLILEYMNLRSLHEKVPISEKLAQIYFRQIISALDYLHNTVHIVHQDIKPQNILLNTDGQVKLCDFGSACYINKNTNSNIFTGTYAFMAPELQGGKYKIKSTAADVWALGISLFYMLLGRTPYVSRKSVDLFEEVRQKDIRIPQEFSQPLKNLFFRMLDKDPEQRANVEELKVCEWLMMEIE